MSTEILQLLPEGLAIALAALPDTHKERAIRYLGKLIEPIGKQKDSQKLLKDLRDKRFRSVYEQRPLNNIEIGIRTAEILGEDESSTANTNEINNPNKHDVPEDEWISEFENQARHKSSPEMRERFARLLAGEIKKPGTFSIQAIKLLGQIDTETAKTFAIICSGCVSFDKSDPIGSGIITHAVFPTFSERSNGGSSEISLEAFGIEIDILANLYTFSLLQNPNLTPNSSFGLNMQKSILDDSKKNSLVKPFLYEGKYFVLRRHNKPINRVVHWDRTLIGLSLSSVGVELMNIVEYHPVNGLFEYVRSNFEVRELELVEVALAKNGRVMLKN